MEHGVSNLLYRHPELYEVVYDGSDHAVAKLAGSIFDTHLGRAPDSLLDLGCGTGRDLEYLAKNTADAIGVDHQRGMIDYASQRRGELDFRVGDMRTLRLDRSFEAITCFGYALANIHTNRDIDKVLTTCAEHSVPGTLLILELIDPLRVDKLPRTFAIDIPDLRADAIAEYRPHYSQQLLQRQRTWRRAQGLVHDSAYYRLLYPKELEYYLDNHGFQIVASYDLAEKHHGASAFVVARYRENAS